MDSGTSVRAFVIGPDQARVESAARRLQARGIFCETSSAGPAGLRRAAIADFDLVVAVEVEGSWQPTRRLLAWEALDPSASGPPVLVLAEAFLSAERADELASPATAVWDWVECGAADREIVARVVRLAHLHRSRRRVVELERRLAAMEALDPLTGLLNHRGFQAALAREFRRAQRYDRPISLLLCDMDRFRSLNDSLGHPRGDLLLQEVAAALRVRVRAPDVVARYGGEEFAVLLPETAEEGAGMVAQRLRAAVDGLGPALRGQPGLDPTREDGALSASIGIACYPGERTATAGLLLSEAQRALSRAKQAGRNRAVSAEAVPAAAPARSDPAAGTPPRWSR